MPEAKNIKLRLTPDTDKYIAEGGLQFFFNRYSEAIKKCWKYYDSKQE